VGRGWPPVPDVPHHHHIWSNSLNAFHASTSRHTPSYAMSCVAYIAPSIPLSNPPRTFLVLQVIVTSLPAIDRTDLEMSHFHVSIMTMGLTPCILYTSNNLPNHNALYISHGVILLAIQLVKLANECWSLILVLPKANNRESTPPIPKDPGISTCSIVSWVKSTLNRSGVTLHVWRGEGG
jgi:hypothetical protein